MPSLEIEMINVYLGTNANTNIFVFQHINQDIRHMLSNPSILTASCLVQGRLIQSLNSAKTNILDVAYPGTNAPNCCLASSRTHLTQFAQF